MDNSASNMSAISADEIRAGEEMAEAARHLIAALDEGQRALISFPFADEERLNWDSGPRERKGLTFAAMASEQRLLAFALMASGLSRRGLTKALTIMSLEKVLWEIENRSARRDPDRYYVSIFGQPGAARWGWRIEGHHCSINVTVLDGRHFSAGPAFRAANPAQVMEGPRAGLRVLGDEEDAARALLAALDPAQRASAHLGDAPPMDTVTGIARRVDQLMPAGLEAVRLNPTHSGLLRDLIRIWTGHYRDEIAGQSWRRLEAAGMAKVRFAWIGGERRGEAHYYRVHGPTMLIEFSNAQNRGNHVHAVWRELDHDFAAALMR